MKKRLDSFMSAMVRMFMFVTAFFSTNLCVANASWYQPVTINDNADVDPGTMIGNILGMALKAGFYIGLILIVWGTIDIVISIMQERPEAKTQGVKMLIVGAILVGLRGLMIAWGVFVAPSN